MVLSALRQKIRGMVHDRVELTFRQVDLLLSCAADGPQTVRGMAEAMRVDKPAITRAADRLAEYGLLERQEDEADRRSVLLAATRKGKALAKRLDDAIG